MAEPQEVLSTGAELFDPHMRRDAGRAAPLYFCVRNGEMLVEDTPDGVQFPAEAAAGTQHVIGSLGDRLCVAVDVDPGFTPSTARRWLSLRKLYGRVAERLWIIAGRADQIVAWDRTHRFCGRCATPTESSADDRSRKCPACGLSVYPRLAPAIIVLVTRGAHDEEALLAWGHQRAEPFYSTLAGFVEPGEDLETAVRREVREETGIEITDVRYFGSQPWPFPHQLMVGFLARYAGGEIRVQPEEIREARWFRPADLDGVSTSRGPMSIAGWMIEHWVSTQQG
ncbi:MAG: diphosphatase [Candidatus Eremiobacteraeota bacterium]|nr:diphosphatase [Candidatus Eremiobacteraeota bacterium]